MGQNDRLSQAVKDYKAGKKEAFNILYEESSKYIYTCIFKVMSGNDNAQDMIADIMQDTYLEISRSIEQLDHEERFLHWAGTMANRKCYAYLKKNKKYVLLAEEDTTFEVLSDSDDIIPEEIMQDREKQRLLREIIENELSEMQKLCVIAFYYNEQKQSEIAQELGIPENTVKTNLSRAKAKIKEGVLELEQNKGTKLYSMAPFMLLLFQEEVRAAVIPPQITENVLKIAASAVGSVTAAGTTATAGGATAAGTASTTGAAVGTKGLVANVVAASVKTKVAVGLVGLGVVGTVGVTAVVATHKEPVAIEETRSDFELGKIYTNGEIVLQYTGKKREYILNDDSFLFEEVEGSVTTDRQVPLYCSDGYEIGYIKPNVTVQITEHGETSAWYRFVNPIEGTEFEHLYVSEFHLNNDMEGIKVLPGQVHEEAMDYEIKNKYTDTEAMNLFRDILEDGGIVHDRDVVAPFYDVRSEELDGDRMYMAMIDVPLEHTVEWTKEKLAAFQESGIQYFQMEGYGDTDYSVQIALWLCPDKSSALTRAEIESFFQSDVDLEIRERRQKELEEEKE